MTLGGELNDGSNVMDFDFVIHDFPSPIRLSL